MTLEQVNMLRKANGQEPLTELPEDLGGKKKEASAAGAADTETPEQIEAKRKAAEEEANKGKGTGDAELTDDQLLIILNKRGITAAKLEDLKPKEEVLDVAVVAEQREAAELAFGLSTGVFKKADYDSFVSDMKDPHNLVFADYYDDAKKEDAALTDEEIQAEFDAKYGLDSEKDSRKWKRGMQEIKNLAKAMITSKHSKVLSGKEAFAKHEKNTSDATAAKKKIVESLPIYRADVDAAFNELKKIPVKFSDTESYEVQAMQEHLDELKAEMLKPEYAAAQISAGYDKDKMKDTVKAAFLYKNFPAIAKEVAKQAVEKHAAGGRGIDLTGGKPDRTGEDVVFTDAQKKLIGMHKKEPATN